MGTHQQARPEKTQLPPSTLALYPSNLDPPRPATMGEWKEGLCGCFSNCGVCVMTYFLPCVTAGKNAEAVGESCFKFGCLSILGVIGWWSRATIRGKIREAKGIEATDCNDCLMVIFCPLCALVQEATEMEGSAAQSMARE